MAQVDHRIRIGADTSPAEKDYAQLRAMINRPINVTVGANVNRAIQPLGKITSLASEFEKSMEAANARVIAFGASVGVITGIATAFKNLVTVAVNVEAKLIDINTILEANSSQLSKFSDGLFKIAKTTASSFEEVSTAALEFARQGKTMEETLKRTRDAMILSRLTNLSQVDSVAKLTAITNAYKGTVDDTTVVINKLRNVEAAFAVDAGDLANAMQRTASIANEVGVSFDQLGALITAVQEKTARGGNVIGNAFKTIFTRLASSETLTYLESFNIKVTDMNNELLPAVDILKQVADRMKDLSKVKRLEVLEQIASKYNVNSLSALMEDFNSGDNSVFNQAELKGKNAGNAALLANDALNTSTKDMFKNLISSIAELGVALADTGLLDTFKQAISVIQQVVDKVSDLAKNSEEFRGIMVGLTALLQPAAFVGLFVIGKSLLTFANFAKNSLQSYVGMNSEAKQLELLTQQVGNALGKNKDIQERLNMGLITQKEAEKQILAVLLEQIAARDALASATKGGAQAAYKAGMRFVNGELQPGKDGLASTLSNPPISAAAKSAMSHAQNAGALTSAASVAAIAAVVDKVKTKVEVDPTNHYKIKAGLSGMTPTDPKVTKDAAERINREVDHLKSRLLSQSTTVESASKELKRLQEQYRFSSVVLGKFNKDIAEYTPKNIPGLPPMANDPAHNNRYRRAQRLTEYANRPPVEVEDNKKSRVGRLSGALNSGTGFAALMLAPLVAGLVQSTYTTKNSEGLEKERYEKTKGERFKDSALTDITSFAAGGAMVGGAPGLLIGAAVGLTASFIKMDDSLQDLRERSNKVFADEMQRAKGLNDVITNLKKMGGNPSRDQIQVEASKMQLDPRDMEALGSATSIKQLQLMVKKLQENALLGSAFGEGAMGTQANIVKKNSDLLGFSKIGFDYTKALPQLKEQSEKQISQLLSTTTDDGQVVYNAQEISEELEKAKKEIQKSRVGNFGVQNPKGQLVKADDATKILEKLDPSKVSPQLIQGLKSAFEQSKSTDFGGLTSYIDVDKADIFVKTLLDASNAAKKMEEALKKAADKVNFQNGSTAFRQSFNNASLRSGSDIFKQELNQNWQDLVTSLYEPLISATDNQSLKIRRDIEAQNSKVKMSQLELTKNSQNSLNGIIGNKIFDDVFSDSGKAREIRESAGGFSTEETLGALKTILKELNEEASETKDGLSEEKEAYRASVGIAVQEIEQRKELISQMKTETEARGNFNLAISEAAQKLKDINSKISFESSQAVRQISLRSAGANLQSTRESIGQRNFFGTTAQKGQLAYRDSMARSARNTDIGLDSATKEFNLEMQKNLALKENTGAIRSLTEAFLMKDIGDKESSVDSLVADYMANMSEVSAQKAKIRAYETKALTDEDLIGKREMDSSGNFVGDRPKSNFEQDIKKLGELQKIESTALVRIEEAKVKRDAAKKDLEDLQAPQSRSGISLAFGASRDELMKGAQNYMDKGGNLTEQDLGNSIVNGSRFADQIAGESPDQQFAAMNALANAFASFSEKLVAATAEAEENAQAFKESQEWISRQLLERKASAQDNLDFVTADPRSTKLDKVQALINRNREFEGRAYGTKDEGKQMFGAEITDEVNNFQYQLGEMTPRLFRDNMVNAMTSAISGASSLKDALLGAALSFTQELNKAFAQKLMNGVMQDFGFNGSAAAPKKYARGGHVKGGSGVRDDVPAKLMGGEYVIKKSAVQKYGTGLLDSLNEGGLPQMAQGGFWSDVGGYTATGLAAGAIGSWMDSSAKNKTDEKYKEDRAWAKEAASLYGTQGGPDFYSVGTTMANGKQAGVLSGASNMLAFAQQESTSGAMDQFYGKGTGYAASLEDESRKLSVKARMGLYDSRISDEVSSAKEQAFGTYASSIQQAAAAKEAEKEAKKQQKRQLIGSVVGAVTLGLLSGAYSNKIPKAVPVDENNMQPAKQGAGILSGLKNALGISPTRAASSGSSAYKDEIQKMVDETRIPPSINSNGTVKGDGTNGFIDPAQAFVPRGAPEYRVTAYGTPNIDATTAQDIAKGKIKPEWATMGTKNNKLVKGFDVATNMFPYGTMIKVQAENGWSQVMRVADTPQKGSKVIDMYAGDDLELYKFFAGLGRVSATKLAAGGMVNGGSGSRDDVNALLMGGEYVLNKNAVQKYGKQTIESINKGSFRMAGGGMVGEGFVQPSAESIPSATTTERPNVQIEINMTIQRGDVTSETNSNSESATDKERQLAKRIKETVYEVIQEESRESGMLAKR